MHTDASRLTSLHQGVKNKHAETFHMGIEILLRKNIDATLCTNYNQNKMFLNVIFQFKLRNIVHKLKSFLLSHSVLLQPRGSEVCTIHHHYPIIICPSALWRWNHTAPRKPPILMLIIPRISSRSSGLRFQRSPPTIRPQLWTVRGHFPRSVHKCGKRGKESNDGEGRERPFRDVKRFAKILTARLRTTQTSPSTPGEWGAG